MYICTYLHCNAYILLNKCYMETFTKQGLTKAHLKHFQYWAYHIGYAFSHDLSC